MFLFGAIVSLCYIPGVSGAYIATQWPVLSILLPACLYARMAPMTLWHWVGLAFVTYAIVRLFSAPVPIFSDSVYGLWLVCVMACSFWFGSTLGSLRNLYAGLAFGVSISSAVAIFQDFGYSFVPYVSERPAGLYVNGVVAGMVAAMVIVALISERMWLWVPALLPGLVLAGSRGAWLALAIGLLGAYVRRVWVFGLIGVAGLVFLFLVQPQSSDETRTLIWNDTLHFLTPWGWGAGSFFSWLIPYRNLLIHPEYAHNDALQLVFEYGIAAALPISIFAFAASQTQHREWPVIVVFVTAGCYAMPLYAPVTSFLACVVAGRIARAWHLDGRNGNRSRQHSLPFAVRGRYQIGGGYLPVVAGHPRKGN